MDDLNPDTDTVAGTDSRQGSEDPLAARPALEAALAELDRIRPSRIGTPLPEPKTARPPRRSLRPLAGIPALVVDAFLIAASVACVAVGAQPLVAGSRLAEGEFSVGEALASFIVPPLDHESPQRLPSSVSADATEPFAVLGRDLEATIGRYREVAAMYALRRLQCAQLRDAYREVEAGWMGYSVERARKYRGGLPDDLARRDDSLYSGMQQVDRDFSASGCNRP
jgi:hypothetical protein